jgi:hypothetical protein
MSHTYLTAISSGFPLVQCHANGDGSVYENIVWDGGEPIPSKQSLDTWIAANPDSQPERILTKYQFRKLFTFTERIGIDNFASNPNISAQNKAILSTIIKDLDMSGEVQLDNPDVAQGIGFLEQVGLLSAGRAAVIISNTPPGA